MSRNSLTMVAFLNRTFALLLDPAIVIFCALTGVLLTIGLAMMQVRPLVVVGIMFALFATTALMKYATMVTRAIALGQGAPTPDSAVFEYFGRLWAFAPWFGLVLINLIALAIWQWLGANAAIALLVLLLPLVPAGLAVVSISRRPLDMLHVPGLVKIVGLVGWDYAKILLVWLVFGAAIAALRAMPGVATSLLAVIGGCLQLMLVFIATGVVMFHHHEALSIPIEKDTRENRQLKQLQGRLLRQRRNALDQAYGFFNRDNPSGGIHRLKSYFDDYPEDAGAWDWFIDEMLGWESTLPVLLLAKNYFPRLVAAGDEASARRLLQTCLSIEPSFRVHPADQADAKRILQASPAG